MTERLDRGVGALQRLEAADEEEHLLAGEPQGGLGCLAVARSERGVVDSGGDDVDALGVGGIEVDQPFPLIGGGGHDRIRLGDDPRLSSEPAVGLDRLAAGAALVLHAPQRVEGVDEGDAPPGREDRGDPPGQPVVAVDQVVAHASGLDLVEKVGRELGQVGGNLPLGDAGGSGGDLVHHDAGEEERGIRGLGAVPPGVDVDVEAPGGERPGHLPDVHRHAPGVTNPWFDDGIGVHDEHGDAAHRAVRNCDDGCIPYGQGAPPGRNRRLGPMLPKVRN